LASILSISDLYQPNGKVASAIFLSHFIISLWSAFDFRNP